MNRWVFPDLNGMWNAEMHSNISVLARFHPDLHGKEVNSVVVGSFEIVQSLFHLDIIFKGSDDYSNSLTVFVKPIKDSKTGRIFLHYLYDNYSPESLPTDEQYHSGAARVEIDKNADFRRMEGVYWTNRNWGKGLNTAGKLIITKPDE